MKLILLASYICFSLAYSNTPTQYHIQTDDGHNRYFRYQTYNGQYRKEKRFEDGTVIGTYGWVDANNYLRLYNYIADEKGYRIVSFKKRKVDPPPITQIRRNEAPTRPISQSSQQRRNQFGARRDNSLNDKRKWQQPSQSEFANSKMHPKLQPTYSSNQQRPRLESEEDNSVEDSGEYQRPQKSPEFINSKMHPKLRPLYSKRKNRRQLNTEHNLAVSETRVSQIRSSQPEFINSKMHPKLQPSSFSSKKIQPLTSDKDTPKSGTTVSQNMQSSTPEFINSKIHPKLRPDYSSSTTKSTPNSSSFGAKRRRPTSAQTATSNKRLHSSTPSHGKSTAVPEEFRMDGPGGKTVIDFDLGNQYRKEKLYPDGLTIGEHGYVDPMGILRRTFYKSGPDGLKQKKVSYWVGTRTAGS